MVVEPTASLRHDLTITNAHRRRSRLRATFTHTLTHIRFTLSPTNEKESRSREQRAEARVLCACVSPSLFLCGWVAVQCSLALRCVCARALYRFAAPYPLPDVLSALPSTLLASRLYSARSVGKDGLLADVYTSLPLSNFPRLPLSLRSSSLYCTSPLLRDVLLVRPGRLAFGCSQ